VITEDRFRKTRDFMVSAKLLSPDTDWKKAIDTRFIDEAKVLP
jgi:NitT/TauT family transport system substrate-binding protein